MPRLRLTVLPPPHPTRRDPRLRPDLNVLSITGDMRLAIDFAEFAIMPPNLDHEDQEVFVKALGALSRVPNNHFGRPYLHPRSLGDRRSRARLTLRALKQVSDGIRGKFQTAGYLIKRGQL